LASLAPVEWIPTDEEYAVLASIAPVRWSSRPDERDAVFDELPF
jgi:hypothetical protein